MMKFARIFSALVILMSGLATAQESGTFNPPSANNSPVVQTQGSPSLPDVAMGEPLEWSLPKFPKEARKLNVQGDVVLTLHVDEEGKVSGSDVLSGPTELIGAVTEALPKWSYIPYEADGHAIPVTTKIVARFSIAGNRHPQVAVSFEMPKAPDLGHIYKVGSGVTAPKPIQTPDPEYSAKARHDRLQGVCVLEVVVGPDGRLYDIKVARSLEKGLDLKAVDALRKWRFEPAQKDGKSVAVSIAIQVEFHLQ